MGNGSKANERQRLPLAQHSALSTQHSYDRIARYYDLEHDGFEDDLALYRGFATRTGGPVIEAGCGTGRVVRAVARAGFDVVGVDASPSMLAIAREKLRSFAGRVELVEADIREIDLPRRFRLAIFPLDGLMSLPTLADQAAALAALRRHLEPGGVLVVDLPSPVAAGLAESQAEVVLHWTIEAPAGETVSKYVARRADAARQIELLTVWYDEVGPDGIVRRTTAELTLRYLYRFELELLLERCGFAVEQTYGSYDLDEFGADSERIIAVARTSDR